MDRRAFIEACAAGAVAGVLPAAEPAVPKISAEAIQRMFARKFKMPVKPPSGVDAMGGFLVPAQFVPCILNARPMTSRITYPIDATPRTLEEVCRARGVA